ncbi:MAG: AraC family transcriptional regulator ligand-binding domain-containing protein [Sphingomonadales bacterium]
MTSMDQAPLNTHISAVTLAMGVRFALSQDMPIDQVEDAIGCSVQSVFGTTKSFPAHSGAQLLRSLCERDSDTVSSIDFGNIAPFSLFQGLETLVLHSACGADALRRVETYFPIFQYSFDARLETSERHLCFSFGNQSSHQDYDNCCEATLTVFIRLMRGVFGKHGTPVEVLIGRQPRGDASAYRKAFGAPVRFQTPDRRFGAVFKRSDMEWVNPSHDPILLSHAEMKAKQALDAAVASAAAAKLDQLRAGAARCMRQREFRIEHLAKQAGMSVRSAQRVANTHGTSLSQIMDCARYQLLTETVQEDPSVSAQDLAARIGYSDDRALRRALLRMEDISLRELRLRAKHAHKFVESL